jgi:hypothetical protein
MKGIKQLFPIILSIVVFSILPSASVAQRTKTEDPETVLATFRVKPDQLPAFFKLMPEYWAALRSQNLVLAEPHILLRGEENGKPIVVEVFSWKNHDVPEHVPPAIQAYWDKINKMVEDRDGHNGIEFPEMTIVKPGALIDNK